MKRETGTVWTSNNGEEVLRQDASGKFYIPLSYPSPETLQELALAIADALAKPTATNPQ